MKDKVEEVAKRFKEMGPGEEDEFTKFAQEIASISLGTFTGRLLERGLDIAKAIAEFSCELNKPST